MTGVSRRSMMRVGALGALAAPFASARAALAAPPTNLYSRTRFGRRLNQRFTLVDGRSRWGMVLTRVSDLPRAARGDARQFTLTFRSRTAGPPQGSYTFRRPGFAPTTLFVVPSDASRRTYQAVINRAPRA